MPLLSGFHARTMHVCGPVHAMAVRFGAKQGLPHGRDRIPLREILGVRTSTSTAILSAEFGVKSQCFQTSGFLGLLRLAKTSLATILQLMPKVIVIAAWR